MPRRAPYHVHLIFSNLLFGANFSFFVSLTRNWVDFQQIFMLQIFVSALFFIPRAIISHQRYRLTWHDLGVIFLVTLLVVYGWMFMLLWGASYTTPIDASVISTLGPAFTLITAHALTHRGLSAFRTIGVLLCLAGAGILLFGNGYTFTHGTRAYGNLLVLVSVVSVAINTVLIKPMLERYGTIVVMGWYSIIGLAITAPFFWHYVAGTDFLRLPATALSELAYILVLGTVLPTYLLYKGTEKLTSVHTALYRYIQPAVATALALARGQEQLTTASLVAAALIFAGIIMVVMGYEILLRRWKGLTGLFRRRTA